jgi:hypothetical protein
MVLVFPLRIRLGEDVVTPGRKRGDAELASFVEAIGWSLVTAEYACPRTCDKRMYALRSPPPVAALVTVPWTDATLSGESAIAPVKNSNRVYPPSSKRRL